MNSVSHARTFWKRSSRAYRLLGDTGIGYGREEETDDPRAWPLRARDGGVAGEHLCCELNPDR